MAPRIRELEEAAVEARRDEVDAVGDDAAAALRVRLREGRMRQTTEGESETRRRT